jgi:hypothetical protein
MGQIKRLLDDYLTNEEFDLMFDDEYEKWINALTKEQMIHEQFLAEKSAYEEMLADSQGFNNFAQNN